MTCAIEALEQLAATQLGDAKIAFRLSRYFRHVGDNESEASFRRMGNQDLDRWVATLAEADRLRDVRFLRAA